MIKKDKKGLSAEKEKKMAVEKEKKKSSHTRCLVNTVMRQYNCVENVQ